MLAMPPSSWGTPWNHAYGAISKLHALSHLALAQLWHLLATGKWYLGWELCMVGMTTAVFTWEERSRRLILKVGVKVTGDLWPKVLFDLYSIAFSIPSEHICTKWTVYCYSIKSFPKWIPNKVRGHIMTYNLDLWCTPILCNVAAYYITLCCTVLYFIALYQNAQHCIGL